MPVIDASFNFSMNKTDLPGTESDRPVIHANAVKAKKALSKHTSIGFQVDRPARVDEFLQPAYRGWHLVSDEHPRRSIRQQASGRTAQR